MSAAREWTNRPLKTVPPDAYIDEPRAADIMRHDVLAVDATETVSRALELLALTDVHHIAVMLNGRCLGVVDDRALLGESIRDMLATHPRKVREIPVSTDTWLPPTAPLSMIAERMLSNRTDALLVRDKHETVLGIITVHDVLRALATRQSARANRIGPTRTSTGSV